MRKKGSVLGEQLGQPNFLNSNSDIIYKSNINFNTIKKNGINFSRELSNCSKAL